MIPNRMTPEEFERRLRDRYTLLQQRHGLAILATAYPAALRDIVDALDAFSLPRSEIDTGGGSKTEIAKRLDNFLVRRDWQELSVSVKNSITLTTRRKKPKRLLEASDTHRDTLDFDVQTHYIDCYKSGVALEVEWNNKNTFFARDLAAFRALHDLSIISVGVLVTRGPDLQELLVSFGSAHRQKYGATTTHWAQLLGYIDEGAAGACPLVLIGIQPGCYVDDRTGSGSDARE